MSTVKGSASHMNYTFNILIRIPIINNKGHIEIIIVIMEFCLNREQP